MKIEAKKIETMRDHDGGQAFSANIYIDGKKVGYVIEDGWGGPLQVGIKKEDCQRIEAHMKTLPDVDTKCTEALEYFLSELVCSVLDTRELKRKLKKPVAFEKGKEKDGLVEWSKLKWGEPFREKSWDMVLTRMKKDNPKLIFLNELPFDEAMKIWNPDPVFE